jgi:hypothetical protein
MSLRHVTDEFAACSNNASFLCAVCVLDTGAAAAAAAFTIFIVPEI